MLKLTTVMCAWWRRDEQQWGQHQQRVSASQVLQIRLWWTWERRLGCRLDIWSCKAKYEFMNRNYPLTSPKTEHQYHLYCFLFKSPSCQIPSFGHLVYILPIECTHVLGLLSYTCTGLKASTELCYLELHLELSPGSNLHWPSIQVFLSVVANNLMVFLFIRFLLLLLPNSQFLKNMALVSNWVKINWEDCNFICLRHSLVF